MTETLTFAPATDAWYASVRRAAARALELPPQQWAFKSDPDFTFMLEHLTPELANDVLAAGPSEFPELWPTILDRFLELAVRNDALGCPVSHHFEAIDFSCAPSNMRYLWHALIFLRHLKAQSVRSTAIVEIGAGYGALGLYTPALAELFDVTVEAYTTVDLPEMARLQRAYAAAIGSMLDSVDGTDAAALEAIVSRPQPKALFSAYAFAEFDEPTQQWYAERLIPCMDHGFIIWNIFSGWGFRPRNEIYRFMDRSFQVKDDHVPNYPSDWDMKDVTW